MDASIHYEDLPEYRKIVQWFWKSPEISVDDLHDVLDALAEKRECATDPFVVRELSEMFDQTLMEVELRTHDMRV